MTRDQVIAYLLHEMPDDERLTFAERWMEDQEAHDEVRAVEAELLDAYVRRTLPAPQRPLVERFLLSSASQREKLAFAQAVHDAFPAARPARVPWGVLAAAAIVLLAVSAALWRGSIMPTPRPEPTALQTAQPPAGPMVTFFLPSVALRSATARPAIAVPRDTEIVRLDLELQPGDEQGEFAAIIAAAGSPVWRAEPIRASRRGDTVIASVWVPSERLAGGTYDITLKQGDSDIGRFVFSVERR